MFLVRNFDGVLLTLYILSKSSWIVINKMCTLIFSLQSRAFIRPSHQARKSRSIVKMGRKHTGRCRPWHGRNCSDALGAGLRSLRQSTSLRSTWSTGQRQYEKVSFTYSFTHQGFFFCFLKICSQSIFIMNLKTSTHLWPNTINLFKDQLWKRQYWFLKTQLIFTKIV